MQVRLTDRHSGKQQIVSFGYARIQIERMYAAPSTLLDNLRRGLPLVTQNWVYELVRDAPPSGE